MGCGCNAVVREAGPRGRACISCSPFSSLTVLRVERTSCGGCVLKPCRPFAPRIDGCRCSCPVWPKPEKPACCKEQVEVVTKCKCTKKKHCGCKDEHSSSSSSTVVARSHADGSHSHDDETTSDTE